MLLSGTPHRQARRPRAAVLLLALATGLGAQVPSDSEPSSRTDQGGRQVPALPAGLEPGSENSAAKSTEHPARDSEPPLPAGLGSSFSAASPGPPPLPAGLGGDQEPRKSPEDSAPSLDRYFGPLSGFWDLRTGIRVRSDPNQDSLSLAETRLQLSRDQSLGSGVVRATIDLVYDHVADTRHLDFESGQGWLDLRELYFGTPLGDRVDLRLGRQILTWGVGDLVFLNDLFPKDWNAFFTGRDVEYLKAPSDALRLAAYGDLLNIDLVYTPRFDADRYLDPRRLSFYDPRIGAVAGGTVAFEPLLPEDWFSDDEWALRLHRLLGGWELAAYGYRGFWKSPSGFDPDSGRPRFPALEVWGASARGPLGPGILSSELAWYRSREDRGGDDPFVPNDQFRFLLGFERELIPDLTLGAQYYLERTLDHDRLLLTLPPGAVAVDENRHLLTLRLTWLTHSQNVTWSLFTFASPSDRDAYLRGLWSWKASDAWTLSSGFNLFEGRDDSSFFGQFERNSNIYVGLRYGF